MEKLEKLFLSENATILEALNAINSNMKGTSIIVDEDTKLLGTLTDGDIRRAILNGISLDSEIKLIYNKYCKFVYEDYSNQEVEVLFKRYIRVIPVVNKDKKVINYIELNDMLSVKGSKENFVLIMAGGLGTRLRPLTYDIPKPMLKIGDKPILQLIIEQFKEKGFKNILISVNYKSDIIKNYFRDGVDFGVSINYIEENERRGTAGAIKLAEEYLNNSFFVVNGDILTNVNFQRLIEYHLDNDFDMTIGSRVYETQIPYGVLSMKETCVTSLREKPIYSFVVSGGIYVLNPEIIKYIPPNKYYDMTELIDLLINDKKKVGSFPIQEYWMDIGKLEDYDKANVDIQKYF